MIAKQLLILLTLIFSSLQAHAAFSNYNSILIGNKAGGMGGAFTALTGDAAAGSYYNPASLSRMDGATLSAAVNIYNKYDSIYGNQENFSKAPLRINRGSITPIPASSGNVYSFGNFAAALSIVFPDFDFYSGEIKSTSNETSFLKYRDETLWIGGSLAINVTPRFSAGLSMYYSSHDYSRSVTEQYTAGADTINVSEEKTYTTNALIYILGAFYQINNNFSTGMSLRFPSLNISSDGTYYKSQIGTVSGVQPLVNESNLTSEQITPLKISYGVAYQQPKKQTLSFDVSFNDSATYTDLSGQGGDRIHHKPVWNANLGYERFLKDWLALRLGLFTNFSAHPEIPSNISSRRGDNIDMWGFSTNVGIFTSGESEITLGGYYNGGKGHSTQRHNGNVSKIDKSNQVFSFLVGTSYQF